MRPRKYPYKQKPLFPSTKRVEKAISELEALKEHYLSLPDELRHRAKALVGEQSDYVTYYDLEIVSFELRLRFRELLTFFEQCP
ncbi:Uncharacterised protein [Streptococcus pneumoniae]|uniref:Uncharacterized protein n=1 Tax=Streptococcus pneumoniae TaxID=1313 RepID=A0AA86X5H6_STREE|nr:Uncharacterised protein [Streptococcus pneumoniae]CIP81404.1 Uncharacterised protein [Streptococcus pneumoniae]CIP81501.1 Uncharacterised protein [Streptococcus pneumoniae]CIS16738.1 Uncharacterised protein [Streptococcus pneumoniae]CIY91155.1 Uncharacterised protein [Streptococcus pneumoniae]